MDFTQDVIGIGDFGSTINGESQNGSSEAKGNGTATFNNKVPKGTDDNVAEDRKLFVGGLSWETREPQLKEYFEKYGEVESVNLKLNPDTGRSKCIAFIVFKESTSVDKVFEGGNHAINSKRVDVKRTKEKPGKMFLGGLKPELSDDDIKTHFEQYGRILEFKMPFDERKNARKRFGFITFEHEETMKELIKKGKETIGEHEVDLKKATPKSDNFSQGGGYNNFYGQDYYGGGYGNFGYDYFGGYGGAGAGWGSWGAYGGGGRGTSNNEVPKGMDDNVAEDRKLFVGGLSWETHEPQLKEYFEKYGEVESVNLKLNPDTGRSSCVAFIVFKESTSVDKVFEGGNHAINSKRVDVKRTKEKPGKMFLGGLKPELSDDDIKTHFEQYGRILEFKMPFDERKNAPNRFGFITLENEETMKELIKKGKETIGEYEVDLKKATPKSDNFSQGDHEKKKHECNICQKPFITKHGLKQHGEVHEDLDMYRKVLANPNFSWGNSSNKSQGVRTPMFQRDETPAIQRSYMKSGSSKLSIFQQLEKYQKKKPTGTSPELVTIDDPIIHRPQVSDSKEDRDVIEIVNIVSPPGSPKSPKKQAAMKSPVNTLAKDLEVLEVTKPDFLAKLRQKYDTIVQRPQVSNSKRDQDVIKIIDLVSPPGSPKSPKSPELVTIDDPIIHRPQVSDSKEDRDVIEVVNIVSPLGSPKSPKKQAAIKSPVNTSAKRGYNSSGDGMTENYSIGHLDQTGPLVNGPGARRDTMSGFGLPLPKLSSEQNAAVQKAKKYAMEQKPALPDLTDEMEGKINQYLSVAPSQKLVNAHNIPITRKDLDTLRGLNWLNGEIINFYLQMIVERNKNANKEKYPNIPVYWAKVYAMNTFFLPKLRTGYSAIKRWTQEVDIFSFDKILVPVHLDVHWCLAVIDLKKKGVYFYDSMGSDKTDILKELLEYLKLEHMDKKKSEFDTSGFKLQNVKDIPHQENGSDCGMFTLKYAEYLSRNVGITFTQEDMPYFRRRIVYEIVNNKVIHP